MLLYSYFKTQWNKMYVCMYVSFVDHLAPSLIFFHLQWYEDSLTYLKHVLRAQYLVMSLATVICECSLNLWFSTSLFAQVCLCTPGATTNIYGRKYRIQGQFRLRFQVFPCSYKNYPLVLNYTWNDYNGLVWEQGANRPCHGFRCHLL